MEANKKKIINFYFSEIVFVFSGFFFIGSALNFNDIINLKCAGVTIYRRCLSDLVFFCFFLSFIFAVHANPVAYKVVWRHNVSTYKDFFYLCVFGLAMIGWLLFFVVEQMWNE